MPIDLHDLIDLFQEFLEANYMNDLHGIASKGNKSISIDFFKLAEFNGEAADQLLDDPDNTLKAMEEAMKIMGFKARARFKNLPESQKVYIRNVRAEHLGKFISLLGIIRQTSDVRPEVTIARFECPSCGNVITMPQTEGKFKEPSRCSCGRKGFFRLLSKELVDAQRIVLEEAPQTLEGGAQPKRLSVFLRDDLVEPRMEKKTTPGCGICITGIVREIPVPHPQGGIKTRFDLAMEANHIDPLQEDFSEIQISKEDETEIKALAKDKGIYQKLIKSVAPSIYGYDMIKLALALQMFGGVKKFKKDGTAIRGDTHILLVGDPGVAKSQMVIFVSKSAPKARFVAGKGASGAGLTAAVVKDEFLKGWALEAGAMVLADRGILCIDELDKMTKEDTSALHEALEQQQVSIAKANIQATLRAETTVLAAANPKLGRFDPYGIIGDQIDLPPALITRFDLIFIMRDLPDKERDGNIAAQVLMNQSHMGAEPEINPRLLRKYIAYAKQIMPALTEEARNEIKNFYVKLRNTGTSGEGIKPIPITPRHLDAIVRLAEASAKVRLAKEVSIEDAHRAIDLQRYCLMEVGQDPETGQIDIDRLSGMPTKERAKIVGIRELIFEMSKEKRTIPVQEIIDEAEKRGISAFKAEEAIEKLKRGGDIYEPKKGFIEKI
ncbi:MAG TPA: minichromosome maintenance protein MCM [Nanoarchaeota archaeon]|nr:minichromosome maintenance protein MCM [Nanoarchaeota archaeon]